jgi:hypothetical protein
VGLSNIAQLFFTAHDPSNLVEPIFLDTNYETVEKFYLVQITVEQFCLGIFQMTLTDGTHAHTRMRVTRTWPQDF